ncbi:hypothetical protein [Acidisphaera sp. L21]|uniref:hypothetical protein n=1 Tax=Acidisphaera sp. L21 TaxID=1641851 RepID=UPI00131E80FD|nr:hypothetical protein [Acidisphaera sp. L21]
MSYSHLDIEDEPLPPAFLPQLGRYARLAVWSVLNAALVFGEQIGELLAPLFILAGIIWWAVPKALEAITLEGPAADLLQNVRNHVPHDVYLSGSYYSASSLISDGLWLIALVAICRTATTAITTLLLDRR